MKKFKFTIFGALLITGLLLCTVALAAAPIDANTNLAANKTAYGTFINPNIVTDTKNKSLGATSGDVTDTPQYLTVDLGTSLYLDRVRISWDQAAYSNDYSVRTSADSKSWVTQADNLDASTGVTDHATNTIAQSISLTRTVNSSRYVQIAISASSKIASKDNTVKVVKMEVFPSLNQNFSLSNLKTYAVTDTTGIIRYSTSIGAAGGAVQYGTDPAKLDKTAGNSESGVLNSIVIAGLKPNTTYFYQVKATDFYGKTVNSNINSFNTIGDNLALNKKVDGTFSYLPDDKYVKSGSADQVLGRATDGNTGYFTGMASSGIIPSSDQYIIVDLGKSYKLGSVVSYWRKLAYPESLTVQLSENKTNWITVADGVSAADGAFGRSDDGDPMQILSTSVPASMSSARYVKLLVKKGSPFYHKHSDWGYVQLMEVQAFAAK